MKLCSICGNQIHPSVESGLCFHHAQEARAERNKILRQVKAEYEQIRKQTFVKEHNEYKIDTLFYYDITLSKTLKNKLINKLPLA